MILFLNLLWRHLSPLVAFLIAWDVVVIFGALYVGSLAPRLGLPRIWLGADPFFPKAVAFLVISIGTLYLGDLYRFDPRAGKKDDLGRLVIAFGVIAVLAAAAGFLFPILRLGRAAYLLALVLGLLGTAAGRLLTIALGAAPRLQHRLLFLGATPVAEVIIDAIGHATGRAWKVLGYVDDRYPGQIPVTNGFRVLGDSRELHRLAIEGGAHTIVVALSERRGHFPLTEVLKCKLTGIRVQDWPDFVEHATGKIAIEELRPSWLVFTDGFHRGRLTQKIKRFTDIMLSIAFLVIGGPLYLLIAALIRLDTPGPVLFRQERVGEGGATFTLFKFRTMVDNAEQPHNPVWATENDPRITRVGKWLRKSRLDEFPQVINVLRSEMSFVGPRPERPLFVARLQEEIPFYSQRHVVRPGITGWAQVKYKYGASAEDALKKLQYDLYYIKNMSIFLDMVILLHSAQVVLFGKGSR